MLRRVALVRTIPEDAILHSHRREGNIPEDAILHSHRREGNIPEDAILLSHRRENLKSYTAGKRIFHETFL
jgi:hypothetical protein